MARLFAICVLVAFAGSGALAQYANDGRIAVRAGLYQPTGSVLKNEGSSTWKTFGVSYSLKLDDKGRTLTSVGLDRTAESGGRFSGEATSVNYMLHWRPENQVDRGFYAGAAGALYLLKEELLDYGLFPPEPGHKYDGIKPGLQVMAGYEFAPGYFAEIRYQYVDKLASGVDFSGASVVLGTRQLL